MGRCLLVGAFLSFLIFFVGNAYGESASTPIEPCETLVQAFLEGAVRGTRIATLQRNVRAADERMNELHVRGGNVQELQEASIIAEEASRELRKHIEHVRYYYTSRIMKRCYREASERVPWRPATHAYVGFMLLKGLSKSVWLTCRSLAFHFVDDHALQLQKIASVPVMEGVGITIGCILDVIALELLAVLFFPAIAIYVFGYEYLGQLWFRAMFVEGVLGQNSEYKSLKAMAMRLVARGGDAPWDAAVFAALLVAFLVILLTALAPWRYLARKFASGNRAVQMERRPA